MLAEDQVVDAVCRVLSAHGYSIEHRSLATERGYDIVAANDRHKLIIEAKGAGSSKAGTARFGKTFSSGQVFDHVAKAVLKALRIVSAGDGRGGVAFPDDALHRREVELVRNALFEAGIAIFFVSEDGAVRIDSPFEL